MDELFFYPDSPEGGLMISEIPDLQVYTIKTLLIGWISIKTFFLGSKNLYNL